MLVNRAAPVQLRHAGVIFAMLASGLPSAALAQDVRLAGTVAGRAILSVDGRAPRTIQVGESLHGVKLLAVEGNAATVAVNGESRELRLGQQPVRSVNQKRVLTLNADRAGHFYTPGQINQQDVRFMVDTGASTIAMGADQALQLGLDYTRGRQVQVSTANGKTQGWVIRLESVQAGSLVRHGIDAIITPEPMPYVLLGNSFLNHFSLRRDAQVMTIE